ncbi:serine--tRNA ligase, chloroplastic/mitochondrial [Diplogelasinospora grovesii]|uniref:serine--tRNA ligase n=1 Tax=Diplogelasinospora grovesii TaxID=303347 RepID=A0AAN6NIU2_9PEZI|nr:serine--tRNA ligase, chloroplastic/mitochondrial [Diplogelasinospora grovesii]
MFKAPGASRSFTCLSCRLLKHSPRPIPSLRFRSLHTTSRFRFAEVSPVPVRPTTAPKPQIDIKHIRQNADLYSQNCIERNYPAAASYPSRINDLFSQWQSHQREARGLRERGNLLRKRIANHPSTSNEPDSDPDHFKSMTRDELLEEARRIKSALASIEQSEAQLISEMESLAIMIPNLTSPHTPRGTEPTVLSYINEHASPEIAVSDRVWRSHVHIGAELGLLDFAGAATSSGWGWYYLLDEAAQLEQALVSYALAAATRSGWRQVSPPSMVYSHIASACGFQPRDDPNSGEPTQIYTIAQPSSSSSDKTTTKPELCLAGTAEIPLAGMKADTVLDESQLPMKRVAVSRCYRAEAGSRGAETKGLYRVHEFTKVEMFAWTEPDDVPAEEVFDEMVDLQTELLGALGLHCRVLEMPTADLGASAIRKCDIEAFFPSRRERNDGWGEVTSASICTDYQTRRLATRFKTDAGKMAYPWTVNGTALAVPRVLAAILENGWDEADMSVKIPEVLRPWMDGRDKIGGRPYHFR